MRRRRSYATHRPQPMPWRFKDEDTLSRELVCRFCRKPVQWRWLLLRWRHVV